MLSVSVRRNVARPLLSLFFLLCFTFGIFFKSLDMYVLSKHTKGQIVNVRISEVPVETSRIESSLCKRACDGVSVNEGF